jgi:hypothetical protein
VVETGMNHRGIEYTLTATSVPGVWKWQFRIGDEVKTGKTETRINLLAIRRVQPASTANSRRWNANPRIRA